MHGRKKKDVVQPTAEELEKQRQHVRTAGELFKKMLAMRRAETYNQQTMDMTTKALTFHPEFPTLWSYRRELLESDAVVSAANKRRIFEGEMKLLEKALGKSQKVYSIWFHRKWTVEKLLDDHGSDEDAARHVLDTELGLCEKLLDVDERNFHCWNHRAHVLSLMRRREQYQKDCASSSAAAASAERVVQQDASAQASEKKDAEDVSSAIPATAANDNVEDAAARTCQNEIQTAPPIQQPLDFTGLDLTLSTELINKNFSNYSAWHLRAILQQDLDKVSSLEEAKPALDIEKELEWVQQGIYTEPNDQSVWLYHHWLTTLGRGRLHHTITHCALLAGELQVFFSGPTCVRRQQEVIVKIHTGKDSTSISRNGTLEPLGSDFGTGTTPQRRLTRRLEEARRRWTLAWRFVASATGTLGSSSFVDWPSNMAGCEVELEVVVEEFGNAADGSPEYGERHLEYRGAPVLCNGGEGNNRVASSLSPALVGLLRPAPTPERAAVLGLEMQRIEELLEIEPDCKWVLLARGRIAAALSAGVDAKAVTSALQSCAEGYRRISQLDPLRKGFYKDALAACEFRLRTLSWLGGGSCGPMEAVGLGLRHLEPATVFSLVGVRVLSVEGNDLEDLGPILLLQSIEELRAARNRLRGDATKVFVLPRLRRVHLSGNVLSLSGGEVALPPPGALDFVDLSDNPPVFTSLAAESVASDCASVNLIRRLLAGGGDAGSVNDWTADVSADTSSCVCQRISTAAPEAAIAWNAGVHSKGSGYMAT